MLCVSSEMLELLELSDMLEMFEIMRKSKLTKHTSPCQLTRVIYGKLITRLGCDRIRVVKYNYENLDVYQLAKNYAAEIYKLTKNFPVQEQFGLTGQTRKATISIVLNIVGGSSRKSNKDYA